jgi:hypothetical protein
MCEMAMILRKFHHAFFKKLKSDENAFMMHFQNLGTSDI